MAKGRILELDAFRGIAVLAVILFHYTFKYHEDFGFEDPGFLFTHGHYGVQLFFIISGYVIFMTVDKVQTARKFLWLRFTRLFPVYWVCIVISFLGLSFIGLTDRAVNWKAFLFNFTMLQDLFQIPNVDGAYWSLLPELMFYLAMVVLILLKLKKHITIVCLIWLGCVVAAKFIELPSYIQQIMNLKYGMLFIAGIHFYLLKNEVPISQNKKTLYWITILLSLAVCYLVFDELAAYILMPIFFLMFFFLEQGWLRFLKFKPLVFIGTISYPLYLSHQNLGYMLLNELQLNFWIELSLTIVLAIMLGILLHYLVEKPAINKLRILAEKMKK